MSEPNLSIDLKPGLVRAVVAGAFDIKQAKQVFARILATAIAERRSRVLIDCRGVTSIPSTAERFELSTFIAGSQREVLRTGKLPELRVAIFGNRPFIDPKRFGETVALNRGASFKAAESEQEAMQWLEAEVDLRQESGE